MIGMISPVASARPMGNVSSIYNYRLVRSAQPKAMPETPVTPVRPAIPVYSEAGARVSPPWRDTVPGTVLPQAYPAEQAARMRVSYPGDEAFEFPGSDSLPGFEGALGHEGIDTKAVLGADGAQKASEEGECQTCKERKYQDGSDDSSVSYQTPTHIDADYAPAAVRGHELEHVAHEQAKAQKEGRRVVSQTVTLHTDICPECGRVYVSGGTTRTVTKANNTEPPAQQDQGEEEK